MSYKIAIIEDDELIREVIKSNLEKKSYDVKCYSGAETMLSRPDHEVFDLVILDIVLPGISGIDLLERMRNKSDRTPVLMLTVKSDVKTRIDTLNMGADDYIIKPFNMDELLARVSALIRRSHGERTIPANQILIINDCKTNLFTRICEGKIKKVVLSEKEVKLLVFFAANTGETLSRADILEEVWGMDVSPTPRTVDNFILKFRKLFEDNPDAPKHFISVRNRGYRFEP